MNQHPSNLLLEEAAVHSDIRSKPKYSGRQVRPSAFLNQLDLLPELLIPQITEIRTVENRKKNTEFPALPTIPDSSEYIKLPPIEERTLHRKHKHGNSVPEMSELKLMPHKLSILQQHDNQLASQLVARSSLFERNNQLNSLSKRRVEFRRSILVVDLQNGIITKDVMDGRTKPLKRIKRKNTMAQKELENL